MVSTNKDGYMGELREREREYQPSTRLFGVKWIKSICIRKRLFFLVRNVLFGKDLLFFPTLGKCSGEAFTGRGWDNVCVCVCVCEERRYVL